MEILIFNGQVRGLLQQGCLLFSKPVSIFNALYLGQFLQSCGLFSLECFVSFFLLFFPREVLKRSVLPVQITCGYRTKI
jgi:hypothetical protein